MVNINSKTKGNPGSGSQNQKIRIAPIFLSNGLSASIIVPIDLTRKYDIDRPSHVTIQDTQNGILIKKLEVK
jgi:hypothetical protein